MARYVKKKPDLIGHYVNTSIGVSDEQVAAIAKAVASAIGDKPTNVIYTSGPGDVGNTQADIESSQKSLAQIADSMTVQRGEKDSNFEDLGNIKTTKKNAKDLKNTIDLLSNMDD